MTPPLAERQRPGLSATLTGPVSPAQCQHCGARHTPSTSLERWVECDAWDQPTSVTVVLCAPCGRRLIDAHPRLYHALSSNAPRPGCMGICVKCVHRRGTSCAHPSAKSNGGPGLAVTIAAPIGAHFLCSPRSHSGFRQIWSTPATDCSGRALPVPAPTGDDIEKLSSPPPAPSAP